jgi:histidinol-phosphate aminotransferase
VLGVSPEMILAGNGCDDILTIATRTFVAPGGVLAPPSRRTRSTPCSPGSSRRRSRPVPWEKDWSLPTEALLDAKADAIYLANPNAPSGTFVSPTKCESWRQAVPGRAADRRGVRRLRRRQLPGAGPRYANVVISRTMSKAYSLAGCGSGTRWRSRKWSSRC